MSDLSHLNNLVENDLFLRSKTRHNRVWLALTLIILIIGTLFFFRDQLFPNNRLSIKNQPESVAPAQISEEKELPAIHSNILLLGIPGLGNDAPYLTDTILLANFHQANINLISFPRDLAIKVDGENYAKLNSLYARSKSISDLKNKIEEISGLTVNHYLLVDLIVVKELVDKMDGLSILVEDDIYDDQYPDNNHGYQTFEIKQGWRYLDGETALKYVRSRHSTSDFSRMERQQQVIKNMKNKLAAMSLISDFDRLAAIYYSLLSHIETDLNVLDMWRLWKFLKNIPDNQISKFTLDERLVIPDNMYWGGEKSAVLIPRAGLEDYQAIKNFIQQITN